MYLCSFLNILFSFWRLEVIYISTFSSRSNNQLWIHTPFRLHLEFRLFKFRKTKRSANKKSIPAFWYSIILELWSFMWYFVLSLKTLSLEKKKVFYSILMEHVSEEKDLGVITVAYLKLDEYISTKMKKANMVILIRRCFSYLDSPLFHTLSLIWTLHLKSRSIHLKT